MDSILMEPGLVVSLAVFALIGFSVYAVAASSANRRSEFAKRIQSREIPRISMQIMEVFEEPNSVTVAVGDGQAVKFRRDLPLAIHTPLGARIDVYEDGGHYFVPDWETDESPSFAMIVLVITVAPFLFLLAYIIHRFRTVYRQTVPEVRD